MDTDDAAKPKVSVIVPSYNHERFLQQRIDSILNQTYRDFELIILDDASTDRSPELLEELLQKEDRRHPRIQLVLAHRNSQSVFKQWNSGIALARGQYVWIAESDDYADPKFLEILVTVLDQHPHVGLVKCRSTTVDEDSRPITDVGEHPITRDWSHDFIIGGQEDCQLQLIHGTSIANASAVLFRRQLYLDAGWADPSYRMCADWLQWAKMMLQADFAYVAEPLNYYRWHNDTVRKKCLGNVIQDLEELRVCAYLLSRMPVSRAVMRQIYERTVQRWVFHSLSFRRVENSLAYDLQLLRLLRQLDRWCAGRLAKYVIYTIVGKCLSAGRRILVTRRRSSEEPCPTNGRYGRGFRSLAGDSVGLASPPKVVGPGRPESATVGRPHSS
jgi:glycosyltransferase involved in cell wall biosynthesis